MKVSKMCGQEKLDLANLYGKDLRLHPKGIGKPFKDFKQGRKWT
jgi:hypothetical protein